MASSNVLEFNTYRRTGEVDQHLHDENERALLLSSGQLQAALITPVADKQSSTTTDLSELYAVTEQPNHFIAVSLSHLYPILRDIKENRTGDEIDRDNSVISFQAELPFLFALSGWSDGARAIMLALHYGLQNMKGNMLDENQYYQFERSVKALADAPFISFERALTYVYEMKRSGFDTDPKEASTIYELINNL